MAGTAIVSMAFLFALAIRRFIFIVSLLDIAATALGLRGTHARDGGAGRERNRLARDLHDSIKQQIFAIQTGAAAVQARFRFRSVRGARSARRPFVRRRAKP